MEGTYVHIISHFSNVNISNSSFLIFSDQQLNYVRTQNSSYIKMSFDAIQNNLSISDTCLGTTVNESYILGKYTSANYYSLIMLKPNSNLTNLFIQNQINLTVLSSQKFVKMICNNRKIYITFQQRIVTFSMNSSMVQLGSYWSSKQMPIIDIKVNFGVIAYCTNTEVLVINQATNDTVTNISSGSNTCVEIIQQSFISYINATHIILYDYCNGFALSTLAFSYNQPQYCNFFTNGLLTISRVNVSFVSISSGLASNSTSIQYSVINYTKTYLSNDTICYSNYIFNQNSNLCASENRIVVCNNINQINQNNTIPTNNNQTTATIIPPTIVLNASLTIDEIISSYFSYLAQQQLTASVCGILSGSLVVSSIKLSPQFLMSLSLVFDDISMYIHHNKVYPQSVRFFFNKTEMIIQDKLNPQFMKLIKIINYKADFFKQRSKRNQQLIDIPSLVEQDVYFTKSLIQNYKNSLFLTLLLFICMYVLRFIVYILNLRFVCLKKIYESIVLNSQWWIFMSSFIQGILSQLSFDFGIQIQIPSNEQFFDKINMTVAILSFFILVFYSLSFYPLLFASVRKRSAKKVLMPCKYKLQSYIYQPVLMCIRPIIKSFVHAFLLKYYQIQILTLFLIDLFFITLCFKMAKTFQNFLIFLFYTLYIMFFATFDLFFYLQQTIHFAKDTRKQLFGVISIGSLLGITILINLTFFKEFVVKICKKLVKKCKKYNLKIKQQKQQKSQNKLEEDYHIKAEQPSKLNGNIIHGFLKSNKISAQAQAKGLQPNRSNPINTKIKTTMHSNLRKIKKGQTRLRGNIMFVQPTKQHR